MTFEKIYVQEASTDNKPTNVVLVRGCFVLAQVIFIKAYVEGASADNKPTNVVLVRDCIDPARVIFDNDGTSRNQRDHVSHEVHGNAFR